MSDLGVASDGHAHDDEVDDEHGEGQASQHVETSPGQRVFEDSCNRLRTFMTLSFAKPASSKRENERLEMYGTFMWYYVQMRRFRVSVRKKGCNYFQSTVWCSL